MPPDEIRQLLRHQPFRPFRITLANGQSHEVRHPELAVVTQFSIRLGIPVHDSAEPTDLRYTLSLMHVAQLEIIGNAASS